METLAAARAGDEAAFDALVAPHRRELMAYCYRVLGSPEDAEDAFQETLLAAWKGLEGFQQRSSLRTWLYRIACRCCLRLAEKRPKRIVSWDHGPARAPGDDLGEPVPGAAWVEPWPDPTDGADPAASYELREGVELAYVAALQHLPARQRSALILREVLAFSAAEVADLLDTTTASVNSALQRARSTLDSRPFTDAGRARPLDEDDRELVGRFAAAFERADVPALVRLLSDDVRFTMPPLPAWFEGRDDVAGFLTQRVFATAWRVRPLSCNGQPAIACYQENEGRFPLSALLVPGVHRGRIRWLASFIDADFLARLGLPDEV
ncbi:sigma-70 family RNA polymerase sigma factor [Glycomyces scopariae]